MTTFEASSQTTERSLDRPVMTLDLPAILGSMRQEATWRSAHRNAMTLVKQPIFRVVLVALQAGTEIGAHQTDGPITVQAEVITHFGRPNEKRRSLTLRLTEKKETLRIGEVEF